ncbi:MAG: isochorismatase family cysteine hydrolase [Chloroflexota bacterium]
MLNTQTSLMVMDCQVDFLDSDGRYPVAIHQVEPLLIATNQLIAAAQSNGAMVIYIGNEYNPRDLANLFRNKAAIKGSSGAQIDPRLSYINSYYFSKSKTSAFTNSKLAPFLLKYNIKHLVLTGVYATACVRHTVVDALKHGYQVSIVSDAVADKSDQRRNAALRALESKGAHVLTSTQVLVDY